MKCRWKLKITNFTKRNTYCVTLGCWRLKKFPYTKLLCSSLFFQSPAGVFTSPAAHFFSSFGKIFRCKPNKFFYGDPLLRRNQGKFPTVENFPSLSLTQPANWGHCFIWDVLVFVETTKMQKLTSLRSKTTQAMNFWCKFLVTTWFFKKSFKSKLWDVINFSIGIMIFNLTSSFSWKQSFCGWK